MFQLTKTLRARGTPDFEAVLKQELVQHPDCLPLQQGLARSNYVTDTPITAMIISVAETDAVIRVKAGIFYQGVLGGCSCADDPTPSGESDEYCVLLLEIDKATAATMVDLAEDD